MPPTNDNFANATALTAFSTGTYTGAPVSFSLTGQTNVGAGIEISEPDAVSGDATVWYSFTPMGTATLVGSIPVYTGFGGTPPGGGSMPGGGYEIWFSTADASAALAIDIFVGNGSDTLSTIALASYSVNPKSVGYSDDCVAGVMCTAGFVYYIRIKCRRSSGVGGTFTLNYGSPTKWSLGNCDHCPPIWGDCNSETLIGNFAIADVNTSQLTTFSGLNFGTYRLIYCHGAIHAPQNGGWYVTNQWLDTVSYANTYVKAGAYYSTGAEGSIGPEAGASWAPNIPGGPGSGSAFASDQLTGYPTQQSAEGYYCGGYIPCYYRADEPNPGNGNGVISVGFDPIGLSGSITVQNGLPNPVWGLYKINPVFQSNGITIIDEETTVAGQTQVEHWDSGGADYFNTAPPTNQIFVQFNFINQTAYPWPSVTITLTGVSSPSAAVTMDIAPGANNVQFSFETPTSPVTATLSFANAIGDTFSDLSFYIGGLLVVINPYATPNAISGCGSAITQFTFPIANIGSIASNSGTQVTMYIVPLSTGSEGLQVLSGCTSSNVPKTTVLGSIVAGTTTSAAFVQCNTQASGAQTTIKLVISSAGVAVAPDYTFHYVWP